MDEYQDKLDEVNQRIFKVITMKLGEMAFVLFCREDGSVIFDFIFLDGNKEHYADYFEILWNHLRVGGVVMIDDGLFQGDILNDKPTTQKGQGVLRLLESVREKKCISSTSPLGRWRMAYMETKIN